MSEITVLYVPKRRLITVSTGVFSFSTSTFDYTVAKKINETETMNGSTQEALYYIKDSLSVTTIPLKDDDHLAMEEFLYSVSGGEVFALENIDSGDTNNYKLSGEFSKSRLETRTNYFSYTFTAKSIDNVI